MTISDFQRSWKKLDPRIPVAFILFFYLVLGVTVLGFNRTPLQILVTSLSTVAFDSILHRLFKGRWRLSLSPLITSFSLSFLLNYSHDFALLFIPIFFAIGTKYVFQLNGRHFFNPALMGVTLSLLFSENLVTASPAYQWHGIASMSLFVLMFGLIFVMPKVNRYWLVLSFLLTFTAQTALRALIMRHHLPFETLFFGTLSSPPFLIFTFFMITDPPTTPPDKRGQIIVGVSIALVDLLLHLRQSYYTFFYAASIVAAIRFVYFHFQHARAAGLGPFFAPSLRRTSYIWKPMTLGAIGLLGSGFYQFEIHPHLPIANLPWRLEKIEPAHSHFADRDQGDIYQKIDPRVQHLAKWVLSVGDSVAVGDVDGDGKPDVFLTNVLKTTPERAALYLNRGDWQFERVAIPALDEIVRHPEIHGLISNAMFVDYDNSGAQSLFLTVAFGHPILLKNMLHETGKIEFRDVSEETGLAKLYTNSISATFADFNKDGRLDLLILNVWPENLPDYDTPHRLNLFKLPQPEFPGDQRMYNFMHASWNMANNGGKNLLLLQNSQHHFELQDSDAWGLPETRWSLAVGVADFNHDGWPDIYIANDFGPDDLYFNRDGKKFENIKGTIFGSIGRDTYKGMNVSIADFDHTGWFGIYISNVHHAFQAEGSLLWRFSASNDRFRPAIDEVASEKGVLNEDRFGWGATAVDFDNNGWVGLAQANGMVDDTWDKKFATCPDYWYVNEKIARSPPSIHRYANRWGDLRGYCIYGKEQNRIYYQNGPAQKPQFVDVATEVGVTEQSNSRGVAAADFENRGRMDLLFTHPFAEPTFYKNVSVKNRASEPHWLTLTLESKNPRCNRAALGSRVELTVTTASGAEWTQTQEQQLVSGFAAQSDNRLHFGLGSDVKSVRAKIIWCGDVSVQNLPSLTVDKVIHVTLETQ